MPATALASIAKVLRISSQSFEETVEAAASVLLRGGIVALPTDTLYGISTLIEHSEKLYCIKRRPRNKPLGLFLSNPEDISQWAKQTITPSLACQLLPGQVTLIFERLISLPAYFNPGIQNVGVRVPDSTLVRALCDRVGQPLAQTSANISGSSMNPTCIDDFEDLYTEIDLVLDGGTIPTSSAIGAEGSTIIDLTQEGEYRIIRDGCVSKRTEELLRNAGLTPV